jgi:hypothetical protein
MVKDEELLHTDKGNGIGERKFVCIDTDLANEENCWGYNSQAVLL